MSTDGSLLNPTQSHRNDAVASHHSKRRRNMRRWINNSILLIIYAAFLITGGLCLRGWIKYHGIESWPSVDAEIVAAGGSWDTLPTQTKYGGSIQIDSRFVEFQYLVDGKTYRSKTATPSGGGLPISFEPWKAIYKPSSPDIAVLSPVPLMEPGLIYTASFTGIIVLVHLWCALSDILAKKQPAEGGDSNAEQGL